jgi:hypothetical protein
MIWVAMSWYSAGPIINPNGRITAIDYVDTLGHQVRPMVQMLLPNNDAIFKDDNSPIHTARSVPSWFEEHGDALQQLPWPEQSPELNIVEPLWSIFDSRVKSRIPAPFISHQLKEEERHNIPIETIQNLYETIPGMIQSSITRK